MPAPELNALEAIARRGPSALAWEILRRDPAYRAAYAAFAATGRSTDSSFVADWGLHFP